MAINATALHSLRENRTLLITIRMAINATALHSLRENRTLLITMLRCLLDTYLRISSYRQLPRPARAAHLRPVCVIQNSM